MRKTTVMLVVVLGCSVALNVVLFGRIRGLRKANQRSEQFLAAKGHDRGVADAKRDFAAGTPKWYQIGDFGGPVPSDKPGRTLATVGCLVTRFERSYVESYNETMDELFSQGSTKVTTQQSPGAVAHSKSELPSIHDIAEFKADPIPSGTHFPEYRIDRKAIDVVLTTWHQVSRDQWHHQYSHVAGEDRTGTIKLKDGTTIHWMVKPGGLATLSLPKGKTVYLAREQP